MTKLTPKNFSEINDIDNIQNSLNIHFKNNYASIRNVNKINI